MILKYWNLTGDLDFLWFPIGWKSSSRFGEKETGGQDELQNGNENREAKRKCNPKREFTSKRNQELAGT